MTFLKAGKIKRQKNKKEILIWKAYVIVVCFDIPYLDPKSALQQMFDNPTNHNPQLSKIQQKWMKILITGKKNKTDSSDLLLPSSSLLHRLCLHLFFPVTSERSTALYTNKPDRFECEVPFSLLCLVGENGYHRICYSASPLFFAYYAWSVVNLRH